VEVGEARLSDYVHAVEVPATVERLPAAERAVASPVAGTVRAVHVAPGRTVAAGDVLAEVVRDALPQPTLALTEAILKPLNEDHHEAAVAVRTAALNLTLAGAERDRLRTTEAAAPAGVTGRVVREAEYAERRARLELENARHEAERHGITAEQIAMLERGDGEVDVPDVPDVRRVLDRNRLWSPEADALLALLPERARSVPHTIAVLGELNGAGRLSAELVAAARRSPALAEHFLDVAGLVQQGTTPAALVDLAERGGLDPVVRVRAPSGGPSDWDVAELNVRPGARVEAGSPLAVLRDESVVALRLAPAPSDLPLLERALAEDVPLTAEPLRSEGGSPVTGVKLALLTGRGEDGLPGALARVENRALVDREVPGLGRARTWVLRPGLAFVVRVPGERRAGRYVLPADAIAYRGAEAVVLLERGSGFEPVPVRLEHHDARHAVVAADGALFAGDRIVLRGAPALAMALLASAGGGGHGHAHPH
jgi:multidrug efflux pump subunit AcrA (membrane-fusion protein)